MKRDRVGAKDGETLYLCSGEYDIICSLRLDTTENKLYVEFPYPDMRKVTDDELPEGSWNGFRRALRRLRSPGVHSRTI